MNELNKFMNEVNWLVSLLIAIPLSVAGNLLTPQFQNWKASKSRKAAQARLQVLQQELNEARRLAENPDQLNTFLLVALLTVIVLFALPNILGGFVATLYALPSSMDGGFLTRAIAATSGMLNALFNLMAVVRATRAMTVYRRAESFEKYEAETKALLESLRTTGSA